MQTMSFGSCNVTAAIFEFSGRLVVEADRSSDTLAFWAKYGQDASRAMGHYGLDDYQDRFFAFWVEDCFDPPVYVIRADSFESAYEIFCDEFSRLIEISESDLPDYDPETLNYSASGVPIDTEAVNGREIKLLSLVCS